MGKPPPITLPRQVRSAFTAKRSCAAELESKAGYDFIKDEHGFVFGAERSEGFEKLGAGRDNTHITGDGFDDDGGDLTVVFFECRFEFYAVVVGQGDCMFCEIFGDTRAGGYAECHCS